jgi:hypothetical protein
MLPQPGVRIEPISVRIKTRTESIYVVVKRMLPEPVGLTHTEGRSVRAMTGTPQLVSLKENIFFRVMIRTDGMPARKMTRAEGISVRIPPSS